MSRIRRVLMMLAVGLSVLAVPSWAESEANMPGWGGSGVRQRDAEEVEPPMDVFEGVGQRTEPEQQEGGQLEAQKPPTKSQSRWQLFWLLPWLLLILGFEAWERPEESRPGLCLLTWGFCLLFTAALIMKLEHPEIALTSSGPLVLFGWIWVGIAVLVVGNQICDSLDAGDIPTPNIVRFLGLLAVAIWCWLLAEELSTVEMTKFLVIVGILVVGFIAILMMIFSAEGGSTNMNDKKEKALQKYGSQTPSVRVPEYDFDYAGPIGERKKRRLMRIRAETYREATKTLEEANRYADQWIGLDSKQAALARSRQQAQTEDMEGQIRLEKAAGAWKRLPDEEYAADLEAKRRVALAEAHLEDAEYDLACGVRLNRIRLSDLDCDLENRVNPKVRIGPHQQSASDRERERIRIHIDRIAERVTSLVEIRKIEARSSGMQPGVSAPLHSQGGPQVD